MAEFVSKSIDNLSAETLVKDGMKYLSLNDAKDLLAGLEVRFIPHQIIGVSWMLMQEKETQYKGGIMADEMGLGKTVQMIATMAITAAAFSQFPTSYTARPSHPHCAHPRVLAARSIARASAPEPDWRYTAHSSDAPRRAIDAILSRLQSDRNRIRRPARTHAAMSSTPAPSAPSSFTPPPRSSAAPDPTSSVAPASSSPAPGPTSGSSSLYLYTFLATLLLLLCVSGLIVFRGVLVRRRARAALADGMWAPDAPRGGVGARPRIHEVWLRPGVDERYANMAPVAGSVEKEKPKDKPKPAPPSAPRTRLIQRALRFAPLSFAHAPRIPLSAPAPAPPPAKDTAADDTGSDALARGADACVALLVAMPCPRVKKDEEEGLPVLEIGVVRVRVR